MDRTAKAAKCKKNILACSALFAVQFVYYLTFIMTFLGQFGQIIDGRLRIVYAIGVDFASFVLETKSTTWTQKVGKVLFLLGQARTCKRPNLENIDVVTKRPFA